MHVGWFYIELVISLNMQIWYTQGGGTPCERAFNLNIYMNLVSLEELRLEQVGNGCGIMHGNSTVPCTAILSWICHPKHN